MEEAILWTQQQERERTEECEKHLVIGHVEFYSNSTQGVEWTRNQCRRTWGHPEQMWREAEGSSPSAEMEEHTKLFSTPHRQFWFPLSVNPCPCCLPLASKQFYTLSYQSEGFPSCLLPLRKQQTGCMVWTQVAVGMPLETEDMGRHWHRRRRSTQLSSRRKSHRSESPGTAPGFYHRDVCMILFGTVVTYI